MSDSKSVNSQLTGKESRELIRDYIRNERETEFKKSLALRETVKNEDRCRERFVADAIKAKKVLPINIQKFIGTCKKAVRTTMRNVGGTPYSIIRNLFLYWDANKSGEIDTEELFCCMKHLGVKISKEECSEVIKYYDPEGKGEMNYKELLNDVARGEPTLISYVDQVQESEKDAKMPRFEEVADAYRQKSPLVIKFIEAVRNYVGIKMRNEGGTPFQHIHLLFAFYDYDFSNGLNADEVKHACTRKMKLSITLDQAKEIVEYYDRKHVGEMGIDQFLLDVTDGLQPLISYIEYTPRSVAAAKKSLAENPFIPKTFHAPPNKVLEKFKNDVRKALVSKVKALGGTFSSWIREAFVSWDPYYTRKITDWKALQGAAQRIGVRISEEEALNLMKCYDRFNTNEMHYMFLAEEIMAEDFNFLSQEDHDFSRTSTHRTPTMVLDLMNRIKAAISIFIRKSKGLVIGRELLHGTCLKYDATRSGRIDMQGVKSVLKDLKVNGLYHDGELLALIKWFDTNGSLLLDYNSFTRQMYGADDLLTERFHLPTLKEGKPLSMTHSLPALSPSSSLSRKGDPMGLSLTPLQHKNLEVIESPATKLARMKIKKNKILMEKLKIETKLQTIEETRKRIIEAYRLNKKNRTSESNTKTSE